MAVHGWTQITTGVLGKSEKQGGTVFRFSELMVLAIIRFLSSCADSGYPLNVSCQYNLGER